MIILSNRLSLDMISEEELKKVMSPEEAKGLIELQKKAMAGVISEMEETKVLRDKWAKDSGKLMKFEKPVRWFTLELNLPAYKAIAVINFVESLDQIEYKKTISQKK